MGEHLIVSKFYVRLQVHWQSLLVQAKYREACRLQGLKKKFLAAMADTGKEKHEVWFTHRECSHVGGVSVPWLDFSSGLRALVAANGTPPSITSFDVAVKSVDRKLRDPSCTMNPHGERTLHLLSDLRDRVLAALTSVPSFASYM